MPKRKISKYVKYTAKELQSYKDADGSCVKKMNANLHLAILPLKLNDFKQSILKLLSDYRIGSYDQTLQGIILDIHNVKLLGTAGAIRFDDPKIHLDVVCDCYVFKPIIGAIVRGTVRHISSSQLGVIIYRVFSVSIRLVKQSNVKLEVNTEIEFRIKDFNMEAVYPYIEGELVNSTNSEDDIKHPKIKIEAPENLEDIIELIDDIKKDECNESISGSPSKTRKKNKSISFKTEK